MGRRRWSETITFNIQRKALLLLCLLAVDHAYGVRVTSLQPTIGSIAGSTRCADLYTMYDGDRAAISLYSFSQHRRSFWRAPSHIGQGLRAGEAFIRIWEIHSIK
jgi:hypothetical protein